MASAAAAVSRRTSRAPIDLDADAVEQVAGVFQHALDAGRPAVGRAMLGEAERQVELGAGGRDRLRLGREAGKIERACAGRLRLERQHDLEQRVPRQRARRVQHLDQPLERQVLVRVGRKVG